MRRRSPDRAPATESPLPPPRSEKYCGLTVNVEEVGLGVVVPSHITHLYFKCRHRPDPVDPSAVPVYSLKHASSLKQISILIDEAQETGVILTTLFFLKCIETRTSTCWPTRMTINLQNFYDVPSILNLLFASIPETIEDLYISFSLSRPPTTNVPDGQCCRITDALPSDIALWRKFYQMRALEKSQLSVPILSLEHCDALYKFSFFFTDIDLFPEQQFRIAFPSQLGALEGALWCSCGGEHKHRSIDRLPIDDLPPHIQYAALTLERQIDVENIVHEMAALTGRPWRFIKGEEELQKHGAVDLDYRNVVIVPDGPITTEPLIELF